MTWSPLPHKTSNENSGGSSSSSNTVPCQQKQGEQAQQPQQLQQQRQEVKIRLVEGKEDDFSVSEVAHPPEKRALNWPSATMGSPQVESSALGSTTLPLTPKTNSTSSGGGGGSEPAVQPAQAHVHAPGHLHTPLKIESETSSLRSGFEPEGSVEMTPPSEVSSGPPAYVSWRDKIENLLDDADGLSLYEAYMEQEGLKHYLDFISTIRGIKSPEAKSFSENNVFAVMKMLNTKYINPTKSRFVHLKLDCILPEERANIDARVRDSQTGHPDFSIFDQALRMVLDHVSATSYQKFFESELFIEHVRKVQAGELSSSPEGLAASRSGNHSSSSSVSGKMAHTITQQQLQAPSAAQLPPAVVKPSTGVANSLSLGFSDFSSSLLPLSSTHQGGGEHVVPLPIGPLETLDELKVSERFHVNRSLSSSAHTQKPSYGVAPLTLATLESTQKRRGASSQAWPTGGQEYPLSGMHNPSCLAAPSSGRQPYHAYSSVANPVSKNDSEIQSQVTTDDASSSFISTSSRQRIDTKSEKRKQQIYRQEQLKKNVQVDNLANAGLQDNHKMAPNLRDSELAEKHPKAFYEKVYQLLKKVQEDRNNHKAVQKNLAGMSASMASGPQKLVNTTYPALQQPPRQNRSHVSKHGHGDAVADQSAKLEALRLAPKQRMETHKSGTSSKSHKARQSQSSMSYQDESEQSIIDEQIDKYFDNTPTTRTPQNERSIGNASYTLGPNRQAMVAPNVSLNMSSASMNRGGRMADWGHQSFHTMQPSGRSYSGMQSLSTRSATDVNMSMGAASSSFTAPGAMSRSDIYNPHHQQHYPQGSHKHQRSGGGNSFTKKDHTLNWVEQQQRCFPSWGNQTRGMSTSDDERQRGTALGRIQNKLTIIYHFSQENDGSSDKILPYKVPCTLAEPKLADIKAHNPKKRNYRYFFTIREYDGCYREEVKDDMQPVPFKDNSIIEVMCKE